MGAPKTGREIRLVSRPQGEPTPAEFELAEAEVREPGSGDIVVRNLFMSVDPYMRGRMNDVRSYVPPFRLGAPLEGGAVGEVVASRAEGVDEGDVVVHNLGWRDYAVLPAASAERVEAIPHLSRYLGILGMPGLTAWAGLLRVARFEPPDAVFVSGAAGAVGTAAGQIAKLLGAGRVVGSAGNADKVRLLTEDLGFDAAFDYHDGPVAASLAAAAPEGIDVYFDNVGGEHLEAAISHLRPHGRVAACGAISVYNATSPPAGPRNLTLVIGKRLTISGFIVSDHSDMRAELTEKVGGWLADGSLLAPETVVDGLERAPEAFIGMLAGANTGKIVVRIAAGSHPAAQP